MEYEPESNTGYSLAGNLGVELMGDFYRYFLDGQFKRWVQAVLDGGGLRIDPGALLPAEPRGPTELITDTRPAPR